MQLVLLGSRGVPHDTGCDGGSSSLMLFAVLSRAHTLAPQVHLVCCATPLHCSASCIHFP